MLNDKNALPKTLNEQILEVVYWIYGWPYFAFKYFWETSYLLPDVNGVAFGATFDQSFTIALVNVEKGNNTFFNVVQLILDALDFSYIFWWIGVFGAFPYYLLLAIPHSPFIVVAVAIAAVALAIALAVVAVALAIALVAVALAIAIPIALIFGPPIGLIYGVYYLFDWLVNDPDLDPDYRPVDQNPTDADTKKA